MHRRLHDLDILPSVDILEYIDLLPDLNNFTKHVDPFKDTRLLVFLD